MTLPDLTFRQRLIVLFVMHYLRAHQHAPSVQQIAEACGLASKSATHRHLERLRQMGVLDWDDGKPRTLRVVA